MTEEKIRKIRTIIHGSIQFSNYLGIVNAWMMFEKYKLSAGTKGDVSYGDNTNTTCDKKLSCTWPVSLMRYRKTTIIF